MLYNRAYSRVDNLGGGGGQRTEVRVYPAGTLPPQAYPDQRRTTRREGGDERSDDDATVPAPRARVLLALLVSSLLVSSALLSPAGTRTANAAQEAANKIGIVCTSAGPDPTFNLTTRWGYISLPDGTTAYMWGFSEGSKPFQHPGPVLCVNEGDTVTVILKNGFTGTGAPKRHRQCR